jgi:hypothetical protein
MLKKHWNTLKTGTRDQGPGTSKTRARRNRGLYSLLVPGPWYLVPVFLLLLCCAPKYAERPSREGVSLSDMLAKMNTVQSIEAVLAIDYEKNETTMSGDAFLNLSPETLNLRIYYLGFLAGEISEDNGVIKSRPKIDKNKTIVLVDGLKNSFLWWTIKDYTIREKEDTYVLTNYNRTLTISKKDLLPLRQTIELDNGEELTIAYEAPAQINQESAQCKVDRDVSWYQSRLSIQYKNHQVKVRVKSYSALTQ